jgi:hypothetical protein
MIMTATNSTTTTYALGRRAPSSSKILATLAIFLASQTKEAADAFVITTTIPTTTSSYNQSAINVGSRSGSNSALALARKYIDIGGNIDGINPNNEEEDTYNMSKKERRRREREKGAADFKAGVYKQKKTMKDKLKHVNFDKLDEKVSVCSLCVCHDLVRHKLTNA